MLSSPRSASLAIPATCVRPDSTSLSCYLLEGIHHKEGKRKNTETEHLSRAVGSSRARNLLFREESAVGQNCVFRWKGLFGIVAHCADFCWVVLGFLIFFSSSFLSYPRHPTPRALGRVLVSN